MIRLTPGEWLGVGVLLAMIIVGIGVVAPAVAWLAGRRALRRKRRSILLISTCGPCNGGFGTCHCPGVCGDPHCRHAEVGDDALRMLAGASAEETEREIAELHAYLDRGDLT